MTGTVLHIGFGDILLCALLMLIPWAVSRFLQLLLGTDLLVGTVRVFAQLLAVGYILNWAFSLNHPLPVLGLVLVMTAIAGYNAAKRAGLPQVKTILIVTAVIGVSSVALSAFVFYVIIGVTPYFNPSYVIPIIGMSLNGAMNAVSVGARALDRGIRDGRERIEAALSIGATSWQAGRPIVREALRQAMAPAINGLMTAGIVQLPGMMTGQIISGVSPVIAVRYQIVIFYLLTSITAIAAIGGVLILARRYFTKAQQLRD